MVELSDYKGFWSYAEVKEGQITPVSYEALGQARELASQKGAEVSSVLIRHYSLAWRQGSTLPWLRT